MRPALDLDFTYDPPRGALDIVHEDAAYIVVDKPSGLLSVPGKTEALKDCLETRLRDQFGDTLLVHRLDMDTSGLMVFARKKRAQRSLSKQFEQRSVSKTYVADLFGVLGEDRGQVDLPLIADWPNRPLQKVDHETGKPSLTRWEVVARHQDYTRVLLHPVTGRSHQLRVHMNEIGHPILGDRFYGTEQSREARKRLYLHAQSLSFDHPETGERMVFAQDPNF